MVEVGDRVGDIKDITNGNFLEVRPPIGEVWYISEIAVEGAAELYRTNGTTDTKLFDFNAPLIGFVFHVSNENYIKIKNVSGGTQRMSYSGVRVK